MFRAYDAGAPDGRAAGRRREAVVRAAVVHGHRAALRSPQPCTQPERRPPLAAPRGSRLALARGAHRLVPRPLCRYPGPQCRPVPAAQLPRTGAGRGLRDTDAPPGPGQGTPGPGGRRRCPGNGGADAPKRLREGGVSVPLVRHRHAVPGSEGMTSPPLDNLSDFLSAIEAAGELVRVTKPVSVVREVTEIADRCMKSPGGG